MVRLAVLLPAEDLPRIEDDSESWEEFDTEPPDPEVQAHVSGGDPGAVAVLSSACAESVTSNGSLDKITPVSNLGFRGSFVNVYLLHVSLSNRRVCRCLRLVRPLLEGPTRP